MTDTTDRLLCWLLVIGIVSVLWLVMFSPY